MRPTRGSLLVLCAAALLLAGCAVQREGPSTPTPAPTSDSAWVHIAPGGGGWFMCVGAGPTGILIVGSDVSGAYRSLDRGRSWQEVNKGLPWPFAWPVEVDPVDPSHVFIGAPGTGYYRRQF